MRYPTFISNPYCILSIAVCRIRYLIMTIFKKIPFIDAITVAKPPLLHVVVPTTQVVQPRFFVEGIPPIPERIELSQGSGQGARLCEGPPPCVVLVFYHLASGAVQAEDGPPGDCCPTNYFPPFSSALPFFAAVYYNKRWKTTPSEKAPRSAPLKEKGERLWIPFNRPRPFAGARISGC